MLTKYFFVYLAAIFVKGLLLRQSECVADLMQFGFY